MYEGHTLYERHCLSLRAPRALLFYQPVAIVYFITTTLYYYFSLRHLFSAAAVVSMPRFYYAMPHYIRFRYYYDATTLYYLIRRL